MLRSNIFSMGSSINTRGNGKLLISGEYLVLAGATALALPLRFGQEMKVKENSANVIQWTSSQQGSTWFSCEMDPESFEIITSNDSSSATWLTKLLQAAQHLNPAFPEKNTGFFVDVEANYPVKWGLGSSSTLIYLVARWADADPFSLFRLVSEGSGYDIACADRISMIFYRRDGSQPVVTETQPGKGLRDHAYFVNLGNKQDTDSEVRLFLNNKTSYSPEDVSAISELSKQICVAQTAGELSRLVIEHETVLSRILKKESIAARFKNFPGTVKSLGAWGGDFAMFISENEKKYVKKSLGEYGLNHVFTFNEIKARL